MKRAIAFVALGVVIAAAGVYAQDPGGHAGMAKHVMVRADALKWGPGPASLPPKMEAALVMGDLTKPEPFVIRAKMPDGYTIPPHWHSIDENVTVLSGTFLMGAGDKLDRSTATELTEGSFAHMPKGEHHFGIAKGETIIQVHGGGPFDITYVNAGDDPRRGK